MRASRPFPLLRVSAAFFCIASSVSPLAMADVTLNAGLQWTHESNVNGSPNAADRLGDSNTTLSASAVYYTPLDVARSSFFVATLGALDTRYNQYAFLDSTAVYGGASLFKTLLPDLTAQASIRVFERRARQSERNASGWGTTFEMTNYLSQTLWLKAFLDYENSRARLPSYSFAGHTIGIVGSYKILDQTLLSIGANYNRRFYDTDIAFRTSTATAYLDVTRQIAKNWYASASYSHQDNNANFPDSRYKDRIVSLGLTFSY